MVMEDTTFDTSLYQYLVDNVSNIWLEPYDEDLLGAV